MTDPALLRSIVDTYEKYGWQLRRLVFARSSDPKGLDGYDVPVAPGPADAAWFSRPLQAGPVAWEIRYIGPTQYALIEHLEENSSDFEEKLHHIEQRLADAVAQKDAA